MWQFIIKNYKGILALLGLAGTIATTLIGFGSYQGEYKARIQTEDKYADIIYNNVVLTAIVDVCGNKCDSIDTESFRLLLKETGSEE